MSTTKKKTWSDKLNGGKPPHVVMLEKPFAGVAAGQTLAIASPMMVKEYIEKIPHGKTRSMLEMRETFAKQMSADAACPTSSSIFLRIVAEATLEEIASGKKLAEATPFWRIVEPASPLAQKLSCGPDFVEHMRTLEISGE
jgi:hypothetical protein